MKLPKYKILWLIGDLILLFSSFYISKIFTILISQSKFKDNYVFSLDIMWFILIIMTSVIFVFIFHDNNLYKNNIYFTKALHLVNLIKSILYGSIFIIIVSFFIKFSFILDKRIFIILFLIVSLFLFTVFRVFLFRYLTLLLFKKEIINESVIIVGAGKSGKLLATKLLFECPLKLKILGFLDDYMQKGNSVIANLKCLGKVDDLENIVKSNKIDEIIISIDNISYEQLLYIIDKINGYNVRVRVSSELFDIIPKKLIVEEYSNIPVIDASYKLNPILNNFIKRLFDFILSLLGIIILSPAFITIAILVKLSSRGPILYKQKRIGKDGKEFVFLKFRTMIVMENEDLERRLKMIEFIKNGDKIPPQKIINDKRLTKIGKFLRKYSLDELPQLFNVLIGNMSLVGPRPCLQYEYEHYDEWQKKRVKVLPGCTGVWQVWGRSNVSFKDSIVLDLYYVNNMNPWLDLQIILKTFPVLIFGKGGI